MKPSRHSTGNVAQSVTATGVNDDVDIMKTMMHGLLMARVKPYYLYQCDPISGSAHFRTPVEKVVHHRNHDQGEQRGHQQPADDRDRHRRTHLGALADRDAAAVDVAFDDAVDLDVAELCQAVQACPGRR